MALRQRQSSGEPNGVGQMQLVTVAQSVFRRACRCADATGEIYRSVRHAQQFALRLNDFLDQGLVAEICAFFRPQEVLLAEC